MTVPQADIGPVYDLLLATRDGTALACRNKDGQVVNVSSLAYMCSISSQSSQHEETELQHKDQLIQLGSGNLIDREFDQWPQITQGDWSGGGLQRVLTGSTPLSSFAPQSDPTRYWDAEGILWPLTDTTPYQPFKGLPVVQSADSGIATEGGIAFGAALGLGSGWMYSYVTAGHHKLVFVSTSGSTFVTANDPFGAGVTGGCNGLAAAGGAFFASVNNQGTNLQLWALQGDNALNLKAFLLDTVASGFPSNTGFLQQIAAGMVGNQIYVALVFGVLGSNPNGQGAQQQTVRLYNVGKVGGGGYVGNSHIDIQIPWGEPLVQMAFQGDNLIMTLTDSAVGGAGALVVSYNISTNQLTTLATLYGQSVALLSVVGAALFILGISTQSSGGSAVEMYLLQGSSLQDIGPLPIPSAIYVSNTSLPTTYGPYALFAASAQPVAGGNQTIHVFAYDVFRGRLFRAFTLPTGTSAIPRGAQGGLIGFGILPANQRATVTPNIFAEWSMVVSQLETLGSPNLVQEFPLGITTQANTATRIQMPTDIFMSLVDFTSAQPKLFRQALESFTTALANSASATARLRAWIDKDPSDIVNQSIAPDFDSGVVTGAGNPITALKLPINTIARKLVCRVTTGGGVIVAGAFVPAPRLKDVIIQAATGWTRTMFLDLADNAMTNAKSQETAWGRQQILGQPAIDATVAYNFLRQLWRLKGGEVTATFPNGDAPANWLLQDIHWDSPKPFGASFRADQRSTLSFVCQAKMREDL